MASGHIVYKPYSLSTDPDGEFYDKTITQTATSLNTIAPIPTSAVHAIIQVEDADVRIRTDGDDPAAGVGRLLLAGSEYAFASRDALVSMKLIRDASTNAMVSVIYSKGE